MQVKGEGEKTMLVVVPGRRGREYLRFFVQHKFPGGGGGVDGMLRRLW